MYLAWLTQLRKNLYTDGYVRYAYGLYGPVGGRGSKLKAECHLSAVTDGNCAYSNSCRIYIFSVIYISNICIKAAIVKPYFLIRLYVIECRL